MFSVGFSFPTNFPEDQGKYQQCFVVPTESWMQDWDVLWYW